MTTSAKVGSYTGTGAAINLEFGFTPIYMKVWNDTDGDESWEYYSGMAAAAAEKIAADGAHSKITSNGFTAYAGTAGDKKRGMTVGTALSESGKTFRYLAIPETD